ncbi:DUF882 domain-containing protein [Pseudomonadota bacterium]
MGYKKQQLKHTLECADRRRFLGLTALAAAGFMLPPGFAQAQPRGERVLTFENLHTGEKLKSVYWANGSYIQTNLADINHILRDHRTDDVKSIDPALLDLLHELKLTVDSRKPFAIISGYRSPKTNAMLRANSGGVAKRSMHLEGRAVDIRIPGYRLSKLRQAALSLRRGGVGYYPKSGFIHMDTGRIRSWGG